MSTGKLSPIKCGLCFKPPTLVLVYNDLDTGKKRKRTMPLRGFHSDTDVGTYATDLMQSPKHSKYISLLPQSQLDSLLQRIKDAHCGITSPPAKSTPTHQPTSPTHQSSLADIPPITLASPSHGSTTKMQKQFDSKLDKLINSDDSRKGNKTQLSFGSDSLEDLLESATGGAGSNGGKKDDGGKRTETLTLHNGVGGAAAADDPLLGVLKSPGRRPLDGSASEAKDSVLGKLPPLGGGSMLKTEEKKKSTEKSNRFLSELGTGHKPDNKISSRTGDTFATEVPDYSNDFCSESEGGRGNSRGEDLEDKSLAVSELLEDDDDDDSLGLGLREGKFYSGVKLSGSSSGDDFKRLDDIVTPPQLSDDDAHLPPPGSREPKPAVSHDLLSVTNSHEDLNKASDEYLARRKEEMNQLFEANCIKPEDKDYVYDKEVDFDNEPRMESGWDSDDSMSDF